MIKIRHEEAELMAILRNTLSVTVKKLEPGMTREQQKPTQNGDQLEINPAENGWELNILKNLQTQQHPSPKFLTLLPSSILAAPAIL